MKPVAFSPFAAWCVLQASLERGDNPQAREAARAIVAWLWQITLAGRVDREQWALLDPTERGTRDSYRLLKGRIQSVLDTYYLRSVA